MYENLVHEGPYTNKDFFNFANTSLQPRHRWYYFKEGFSPNVVLEAISTKRNKNKKLRILDPFNGCGTTVLTSALEGHISTGIEVNPFLEFTTKVKTDSYDFQFATFNTFVKEVVSSSKKGAYSALEGFSTFSKTEDNCKWLFNTSVLRRFTAMLCSIEKLPKEYQEPFRFIALTAMMDCCNAKKDGKALRYFKDWKSLMFNSTDFEIFFVNRANIFIQDINNLPILSTNKPTIYLNDSRSFLTSEDMAPEVFDLVITSPPYLNSFDYTDIYRPELFLGGFIKDNDELRALRLRTLRSHVQVAWNKDIGFKSPFLDTYLKLIGQSSKTWNPNLSIMISAYFDDIFKVLTGVIGRLKKKGEIWLVVSTSAYAGCHIPVDLIIAEVGSQVGFHLKGVHILRNLRTSSQQFKELKAKKAPLRESLVIFQKL